MLLSKIQWHRKYEGICLARGAPLCIRSRVRPVSSQAALLMGVSGGLQALCGCWESVSRLSSGSALGSNGSASGAPGLARMEQGSNFGYSFTSKARGSCPQYAYVYLFTNHIHVALVLIHMYIRKQIYNIIFK